MSDSIIHIDIPLGMVMARTMGEADQQLDATIGEMNKVLSLLEDGGLKGDAGNALVEAMRSSLIPAVQRLRDKSEELKKDIEADIRLMTGIDQEQASRMG